ncbi:hypothetical protein ACIBCU_26290 [Streptomyces sp. NPDC051064]|uniref:hypothetical protein n=1 Tax=Streptomyces sp. NPDC051064 TaxID=3365641 RepID=UPI0037B2E2EF
MNVDDVVQARITDARQKIEQRKRRRVELAKRRTYGLEARHAAKLRRWQREESE